MKDKKYEGLNKADDVFTKTSLDRLEEIEKYLNNYLADTEKLGTIRFLKELFPKASEDQILNALRFVQALAEDWHDTMTGAEVATAQQVIKFDREYLIPTAEEISFIMEGED